MSSSPWLRVGVRFLWRQALRGRWRSTSRRSAARCGRRARRRRSMGSSPPSSPPCRNASTRWRRQPMVKTRSLSTAPRTSSSRRLLPSARRAWPRCLGTSKWRLRRATWRWRERSSPSWGAKRGPSSTSYMPNPISVLVADDDPVSRAQLSALVRAAGYQVSIAEHGREAWDLLQLARVPVVISDWYMPEMDGPQLCRSIRGRRDQPYVYFILITSRGGKEQYLAGMEAGADDFITKPVDPDELRARLTVAERILGLRRELQQLEGLLPICTYCKRIRNDRNAWGSLEGFIEKRSEAQFSHGICPDCYKKHVQPQLDGLGPST